MQRFEYCAETYVEAIIFRLSQGKKRVNYNIISKMSGFC